MVEEREIINTLNSNKSNKQIFLIRLLVILLIIVIGFFICLYFLSDNTIALITAFASVTSAIIVIPTKIVEYLFNPQETQQINEVIKNIQDYDKAVREDLSRK